LKPVSKGNSRMKKITKLGVGTLLGVALVIGLASVDPAKAWPWCDTIYGFGESACGGVVIGEWCKIQDACDSGADSAQVQGSTDCYECP